MLLAAIAALFIAALYLCTHNHKSLVLMVLVLCCLAALCTHAGFQSGIDHALGDSTFSMTPTSYTDPLGTTYDSKLEIDLDGNVYEQGLLTR